MHATPSAKVPTDSVSTDSSTDSTLPSNSSLAELQGPTVITNGASDLLIESAGSNHPSLSTKQKIKAEIADLLATDQTTYQMGKYTISRELGRGTCGIVYQGFDNLVKRDVAIKIAWVEEHSKDEHKSAGNSAYQYSTNTTEDQASNQASRFDSQGTNEKKSPKLDFFTEAHAAGKLQHPNIVTVYDAQQQNSLNYIVMELVHGKTLLHYCRPDGEHLSDQIILDCMFKCCQALDYSHSLKVIHRDIKPSNIMLTAEGVTKIMDFSVAEVMQGAAQGVNGGLLVGSPTYMSPEQILRKDVGPTTDLYALAAVMYQLLTRKRLYACQAIKETFRKVLHEPPPKLFDSRPDLPKALSDLIDRALSKRIADRYPSGAAMAAELATIYDNLVYAKNQAEYGDAVDAVKYLDFFEEFEKPQLNRLMSASSLLDFTVGQYISKEVQIDNAFYIMVKGQARLLRGRKVITTLQSGDCFGDIAANKSQLVNAEAQIETTEQQSSSLVALNRSVILKIDAARIDSLPIETQRLFYKAFSLHMIQRLPRR